MKKKQYLCGGPLKIYHVSVLPSKMEKLELTTEAGSRSAAVRIAVDFYLEEKADPEEPKLRNRVNTANRTKRSPANHIVSN